MTAIPTPKFDHLLRLSDHRGTYEHACLAEPRPEHGYCTDDMARVLVVATREPDTARELNGLAGVAVRFLNEAQSYDGACRNRMDRMGHFTDQPSTGDHWGRCIWGLGTAAAHSDVGLVRKLAVVQFERAAQKRSRDVRAMSFAVLGAAELLSVDAEHKGARKLVTDYVATLAEPNGDAAWPWPEPRLAYANAVLPEAMIAAGVALDRPELRQRGLDLLAWLLDQETSGDHLSPTPAAGWGPGDTRPGFDQQPIEAAALADACARAATVDPQPIWIDGVHRAGAWFAGANDSAALMYDPDTGGGYDGLLADGVNLNQGAESTLALLSTLQHVQRFAAVPQ